MKEWDEAVDSAIFRFVEELEARGFRSDDGSLTGKVGRGDGAVRVQVSLPENFPFAPPIVFPPDGFAGSWHHDRNGAMCLYPATGRDQLPWLDTADFLLMVERWLSESSSGWQDDFPDVDLESYFERAAEPLVIYGNLDGFSSQFVRMNRDGVVTRLVGRIDPPRKRRAARERLYGFVADLGEPSTPPTCWEDLKTVLAPEDVRTIESGAADGTLTYLVIRYHRGGASAVLVLRIAEHAPDGIQLRSVSSASDATSVLTLRAGRNSTLLSQSRVAVVGIGAIGSFLCDLLARAGVGAITAVDPDVMRPGNLIRHVASDNAIGLTKPAAIKQLIESRSYNMTSVRTASSLPTTREVMDIFRTHDLVIDATAESAATQLLATAARIANRHMVTVCVQEEGSVVRVDVIPPLDGKALPATELGARPAREDLRFEAGCGDPVSQTPAYAVIEAAALATRHAVGLLTGSCVSNAGTSYDYR